MSSLSQNFPIRRIKDAAGSAHAHNGAAFVIVNADDWGRDSTTTDRTLDCYQAGAVSSVSAMVFMADSRSAAELAREHCIDAGLHLNFTTPYNARNVPARLAEHQRKIADKLERHRYASVLYYPGLAVSFEYTVKAQIEEFERLYGQMPRRLDGHHHMHLCANVLRQQLLPTGTIVRRNLCFAPGERHFANRLYRNMQDRCLARRHRITDYFFDLHPADISARLKGICQLGSRFSVEIETHPIRDAEYSFLMSGQLQRCSEKTQIASRYLLRSQSQARAGEKLA